MFFYGTSMAEDRFEGMLHHSLIYGAILPIAISLRIYAVLSIYIIQTRIIICHSPLNKRYRRLLIFFIKNDCCLYQSAVADLIPVVKSVIE